MAFTPKYLSLYLAFGFILHLTQGKDYISVGVEFHYSPDVIAAVQKSALTINCTVTSTDDNYGPLTYTWQKDGQPLNSPRVELLNNGSLYFRKIRKNKKWNDEGVYQCIATNNKGSVLCPEIRVRIKSIAKNFTKEPTPWQGYLGGVARFECNINSVPPATYVWQKDRKNIPPNSKYTELSSGVLLITDLKYSDAGLYRCVVFTSDIQKPRTSSFRPKPSKEAQLTVLYASGKQDVQMVVSPRNITGKFNSSAVLECVMGGNPLPTVIWSRKGLDPIRGKQGAAGSLYFESLIEADAGKYICSSNSSFSPVVSAEAFITVESPPQVLEGFQSQVWPISRNVIFDCRMDGDPSPDVKLYFNGKPINRNSERLDLRPNRLVVFSAVPDHSGYYQCIGKNTVGQNMSTALLEIYKTQGAPEPPTNVTGIVMSSSTIFLSWSPSDTTLLTNMVLFHSQNSGRAETKFVQKDNITLTELQPNTNYTLCVKSFNSIGASQDSKRIHLTTLEDIPYVAPQITLHSTQSDNIVVEWQPLPFDQANGKIIHYEIYFRRDSSFTEHKVEIDGSHKSYIIPGLDANTDYQVRVLAATSLGYPDLSDEDWPWVDYHTPKNTGLTMPVPPKLWLSFVNSSTATFVWQQKDLDRNTTFNLSLRNLVSNNVIDDVKFPSSATSYTISNLENNTAYEVTLSVKNSRGESSVSSKEFFTSDKGIIIVLSKVEAKAVSPSIILLSWNEDQPVDSYEVCYFPLMQQNLMKCMETLATSAKMSNLKAFTKYGFKVRPKYKNKNGDFSKVIVMKTKQDVPSAPTNITWEMVSPGIVEIHWHPPVEPNGVITSYIIFYNIDESMPESKWNNLTQQGVVTTARVDELTEMSYFVKLSACTEAGRGGPSQVITVYPRPCFEGHHDVFPCNPNDENNAVRGELTGQQVGIIVGVTIGFLCIIICILVIVFRRKTKTLFRCFYNDDHTVTPPAPVYHGNGHIPRPGNGHVHTSSEHIPLDLQEVDAYTPMLTTLLENEQSDSKGGGTMIVTPNGVKSRGFSNQNGHVANGYIPSNNSSTTSTLDAGSTKEEQHGLIAAMLAATDGSVTGDGSDTAANTSSIMEGENGGSLEDLDHSDGSDAGTLPPQSSPPPPQAAITSPIVSLDSDPCLIEAATPAVITDTGQSLRHNQTSPLPNLQDSLSLRNKQHHQSTTTSSRANKGLPPPPPDPPSYTNQSDFKSDSAAMPNSGPSQNSLPPRVIIEDNSHVPPYQFWDGRTVSAAKNSHSVV